jgi:hypothetical protein
VTPPLSGMGGRVRVSQLVRHHYHPLRIEHVMADPDVRKHLKRLLTDLDARLEVRTRISSGDTANGHVSLICIRLYMRANCVYDAYSEAAR